MSKRKDNKGRILRTGESQRADGQYMYRYTDIFGKRKTIYSWRLTETDKNPSGKNSEKSLRELEKIAQKRVSENQIKNSETINSLFDKFLFNRTDLKISTKSNYICLYDAHVRSTFGERQIDTVRYTDVYSFYLNLNAKGLKVRSIQTINAILKQLFFGAEKDRLIFSNPVDGAMAKVIKSVKEEDVKKRALTKEQQESLIDYIYESPTYNKYGPLFTVLLGTGMRIGEALGLTWKDVDLENSKIYVDHALRYIVDDTGKHNYHIMRPKTIAGIRVIPMFNDVKQVLQKLYDERITTNSIEGYSGFVFANSQRNPYTPGFIFDVVNNLVFDHNKERELQIPKISPHTFRHTFCTRMCEIEPNIKLIQDIMGHKHLSTTMAVYNEVMDSVKEASFENLEGKMKIS